jgi:hypothetical protein
MTTFIVGMILPSVFLGFHANNELLNDWVETMKGHNTNINSSPDTIYNWINKILAILGFRQENLIYSMIILALIAGLFLWLIFRKNSNKPVYCNYQKFSLFYLLVIALVPSITLTDSEHFLFSLPIVMLSLFIITSTNYLKLAEKFLLITAFVLYGGNWHDLWGHSLSVAFSQNGLLGLGNIMLIGMILWKGDLILKKNF